MNAKAVIAVIVGVVMYLVIIAIPVSEMSRLFIFLGVIVILPYVVGPILIRYRQRLSANPQLEPKAPQDLSREVSEFFQRATQDLTGEGLTGWPPFAHRLDNVTMYLKLFLNNETGDSITATAIYSNLKGAVRLRAKNLIITTKLDDGQWYTTSNASVPGIFCRSPDRHGLFLPQVQDNSRLYRINRAWLHKAAPAGRPVLPAEGREIASVAEEMADSLARQVQLGFYYIDPALNRYRPTWKGAVLMTWKMCWPVKQIRKALRIRKDKRIVRRLGF